jgi:hypothetical protein
MRKIASSVAILYLALIGPTIAQILPAPIGHRQPTAADVPSDDSVQGLGPGEVQPTGKTKPARSRYNEMSVPNICWNCDK